MRTIGALARERHERVGSCGGWPERSRKGYPSCCLYGQHAAVGGRRFRDRWPARAGAERFSAAVLACFHPNSLADLSGDGTTYGYRGGIIHAYTRADTDISGDAG